MGCALLAPVPAVAALATRQVTRLGDKVTAALRGAGEPNCVFVDSLVLNDNESALTLGAAMAAHAGLVVSGVRCDHALVASVDVVAPGDAASTLLIRLNRAYGRFRAQPCREDRFAADGAAPVRFEVWGDDALLYQSDALRPADPVSVAHGVDVSVRGVATLKLVVRYADTNVEARQRQNYARGCVWAMARLLPPMDATDDDPVDAARLRGALRAEVARLAALTETAVRTAESPLTLPLRIYVGAMAGDSTDYGDQVRTIVAELLEAANAGESSAPVFTIVGDTGNKRRRGRRRPSADENRVDAQRDAARSAGAIWLLLLALEPSADNNSAGGGAANGASGSVATVGPGATANLRLTLRIVSVREPNAPALSSMDAPAPGSPPTSTK